MSVRAVLIALVLVAFGCVGPRPAVKAQASLYRDYQRHITVASAAGWLIDRYEVEELMRFALPSMCRVSKPDRVATLAWVDAEIERKGGPVEEAYIKRGKKLKKVEDLLELTRIRLLLATAMTRAETECPFWVEPEPNFSGLQLLDDSWVLTFGGGGKAILFRQEGQFDVSAGGAGRMLIGRALGSRWLFSFGGELGALAEFPRNDDDDRGALVLGLEFVAPVVARYRLINSYFELEAGPLVQGREDRDDLVYGLHVGGSFGAQATRRLFVLPGGAFTLSFERTFETDLVPTITTIKMGFRAAIDLPF